MRQNHLQIKAAHHLSNHQEHTTLTFPALWELALYLARHIVRRCSIFFRENSFKSSIQVCRPQCKVTINCKFFTVASIEGIYQLLIVSYVLASGSDLVTPSRGSSESTGHRWNTSRYKALYFLVPSYSGVQDFWVLRCTALYRDVSSNGKSRSCCVLVHTSS